MKLKFITALASLFISSQAFSASPPNTMQTWILMGDSIMSAVSPNEVDGLSGKANKLATHLVMNEKNVSIRNISSPGNSMSHTNYTGFGDTSSVTASLDRIGGFFGFYNGIIIQVGTNDFGRDVQLSNFSESLRGILKYASSKNKKVMMMEPIWRRNELIKNKAGFNLNSYRATMKSVCQQEYPTICHFSSRVNSKLANASSYMYFDANEVKNKGELHLNSSGHRAYADWIKLEASNKKWF
jgi:lysophospholipase L1-like esterase